jgi:hypothetical protein
MRHYEGKVDDTLVFVRSKRVPIRDQRLPRVPAAWADTRLSAIRSFNSFWSNILVPSDRYFSVAQTLLTNGRMTMSHWLAIDTRR